MSQRGQDTVEFFLEKRLSPMVSVPSSMPPHEGTFISIRKKLYRVVRVTYCVDHADEYASLAMRANVELTLWSEDKDRPVRKGQ